MRPTADDIAHAIVAASRETGADPIAVVTGQLGIERGRRQTWEISRARNYAGWALRKVFQDCPPGDLARMVGVGRASVNSFWGNIDFNLRNNRYKWWNAAAFDRVAAAIRRSAEGHQAHAALVAEIGPLSELPAPQAALALPTTAETKTAPSVLWENLRELAAKPEPVKRPPPEVLRQRDLGEMVTRRKPAKAFVDMTAELCGDPPPARSALAERAPPRKRQIFGTSSSVPHDPDDGWMRTAERHACRDRGSSGEDGGAAEGLGRSTRSIALPSSSPEPLPQPRPSGRTYVAILCAASAYG